MHTCTSDAQVLFVTAINTASNVRIVAVIITCVNHIVLIFMSATIATATLCCYGIVICILSSCYR